MSDFYRTERLGLEDIAWRIENIADAGILLAIDRSQSDDWEAVAAVIQTLFETIAGHANDLRERLEVAEREAKAAA